MAIVKKKLHCCLHLIKNNYLGLDLQISKQATKASLVK